MFGVSSNDTHPILMSSNNLSRLCPGLPTWYSQVKSSLYQIGNGGCNGNVGIRDIYPMLSSLAYMSFKGMGNGGSCSEMYLAFGLWWLFDWLLF